MDYKTKPFFSIFDLHLKETTHFIYGQMLCTEGYHNILCSSQKKKIVLHHCWYRFYLEIANLGGQLITKKPSLFLFLIFTLDSETMKTAVTDLRLCVSAHLESQHIVHLCYIFNNFCSVCHCIITILALSCHCLKQIRKMQLLKTTASHSVFCMSSVPASEACDDTLQSPTKYIIHRWGFEIHGYVCELIV